MWGARIILLGVALSLGVTFAPDAGASESARLVVGLLIGLGLAAVPLALDVLADAGPWRRVAGGVLGFAAGLGAAGVVLWASDVVTVGETASRFWPAGVLIALGYLGWRFGSAAGDAWDGAEPRGGTPVAAAAGVTSGRKLLDTSVIISAGSRTCARRGFSRACS